MKKLSVVEVGPRDGFQAIVPFIPTADKITYVRRLHAAGLRRIEIGSFVSAEAIPQLADTVEVMNGVADLEDFDPQVLVPTRRRADAAIEAGSRHLAFVLSVSESHNRNNVRRHPLESATEYQGIVEAMPPGTAMRLNVATAFDCPFEGAISIEQTLSLLDELVEAMPAAEIALCDTTGRVTPDRVDALFRAAADRFPQVGAWAFHGHDTYGLGVANTLAAVNAGAGIVDASFAGLGGCPFAPGATGNVATEDVVWTADQMGFETGIDLQKLLAISHDVTALPGAPVGGRVRIALAAKACLTGSKEAA